jgi:hypothetical protein
LIKSNTQKALQKSYFNLWKIYFHITYHPLLANTLCHLFVSLLSRSKKKRTMVGMKLTSNRQCIQMQKLLRCNRFFMMHKPSFSCIHFFIIEIEKLKIQIMPFGTINFSEVKSMSQTKWTIRKPNPHLYKLKWLFKF